MEKVLKFIREHIRLLATISVLLVLASFFLPLLEIETDTNEYTVNILNYFEGNKMDFVMFIILGLLLVGIAFVWIGKLNANLTPIGSMSFIIAIPLVILLREFYTSNGGDYDVSIKVGIPVCLVFLILSAVLAMSISYQKDMMSPRDIAEEAILIALAFILNFLKIGIGSTGGSINFQMLPLFILALRHGPTHGLISGGVIYGLLTCLTDGYGFACYPFDYLIGFGSIMAIGLFRDFIIKPEDNTYTLRGELFLALACVLATFIRFVGSTMSSMIIWDVDFAGALSYNVLYVLPSGAIAMIVVMALLGPIVKINKMFPVKKEQI